MGSRWKHVRLSAARLEIAPPRNIPITLISSIRPGIHGRGPKNEKGVQGD